jgi:hypothetical protein
MFDTTKSLTARLTDAVDLLIDFTTLGEYGLEPVGRTAEPCEGRHRDQRKTLRSPGRAEARARGVRGASGTPSASGVA